MHFFPGRETLVDEEDLRITPEPTEAADFSSDDSVVDTTYAPEINSSSSSESSLQGNDHHVEVTNITEEHNQRRKSKGTNIRKIIQDKRNKGLAYKTLSGKIIQSRKVTPLSLCRKKCSEKISADTQKKLFDELWALGDYNKRSAYLSSLILDIPKKSQRIRNTLGEPKLRSINHIYNLKVNGTMIEICKGCFLKTFGISNKCIEVAIKKKSVRVTGISSPDKRGSHVPSNKIGDDAVQAIKDHINSYPLYESHYSRSHTNKRYLPTGLSLTIMYQMYKETISNPVSYTYFGNVFRTMGLSFKKPSLDTCNTCDAYKMKIKLALPPDTESLKNDLETHQAEADSAYSMKKKDKEESSDVKRVYCFDLQQCLPTPFLKTNIVFYKRLLWTYNLTIYDCYSKKSFCYMWSEADGGRGANQIASCLYNFLMTLPSHVKEVTFYSDTCGGQNKNSHVAAMFLCISKMKPGLLINHKFLVPGHTHMECDSVHAQIERKKKRTDMAIHLPRDWYNLVRMTSPNISVVVMQNSMFLNFAKLYKGPLQLRKVDASGEKFIWHDVKWFRFSSEHEPGVIQFKTKLDNSTEFKEISFCRRGKSNESLNPEKCYDCQVPINQEKKRDLLSILHLIDSSCHDFYNKLETSANTRDIDPDIEEFSET